MACRNLLRNLSPVKTFLLRILHRRAMIQNMMNEEKIVPSEVTIKLLERAMVESGNDKFLIDGFP
ncbi:hypothetical protein RJ641_000944 [Dillenia turbinata]|uniref:Adenylate kinase n=1 Tax=Dillenia turbinata TaxID=194707 RepID=A0AAN8WGD6_9MAGN